MRAKRLLLIDDHPLIRSSMRQALQAEHPELVVEEAGDVAGAVDLAQSRSFNLVLIDYKLPDSCGFDGLIRMQALLRRTPIAIISAFDRDDIVQATRALDAAGFISKRIPLSRIVELVRLLLRGEQVFPEIVPSASLEDLGTALRSLSLAQKQVLSAMVSGDLNKLVASKLEISEATVKTHLTAIFRKLGVSGRAEAVVMMKPILDPDIESQ